ncbi:MAG: thiamine phosphate synthase [Pseudomonadota bacterium]
MAETDAPQIYLVSPPAFELSRFPGDLARVLDARPVACVRLALATRDEDRLIRAADALREVTTPRDVALVMSEHVGLAERLGLDGVHLDGTRGVRAARSALGADAIVGAFCGASRHDAMVAGESGADYVALGPLTGSALGDGQVAASELFQWWTEMMELPVVAEGGLTEDTVRGLWDDVDFFAVGEEIWASDDPVSALDALVPR